MYKCDAKAWGGHRERRRQERRQQAKKAADKKKKVSRINDETKQGEQLNMSRCGVTHSLQRVQERSQQLSQYDFCSCLEVQECKSASVCGSGGVGEVGANECVAARTGC